MKIFLEKFFLEIRQTAVVAVRSDDTNHTPENFYSII